MKQSLTLSAALIAALGLAACDADELASPEGSVVPSFAQTGFQTAAPLQAEFGPGYSGTVNAIVTVDDPLPGGEFLAGTLDGIGIWGGQSRMNLAVTHEISWNGQTGSRVSYMTIDTRTLGVLDHYYPVDGSEGYNRFCSAEWVDAEDGFPGGYFFAGEEDSNGVQTAIDDQGRLIELPHIGYYAHENQMSVPGFPGHVVVLNTDDNGGRGVGRDGSTSELYMYVARSSNQVLRGQGRLYVFAADDPDALPNDLSVGGSLQGHWIPVPEDVALDYQDLEQFVDDELAYPFIRLEDVFYDKRPGAEPGAFIFDTGRSSITDPVTGDPIDPWGSIYHIGFDDPRDPAGGAATLTLVGRSDGTDSWASPDNGDMNAQGEIMLQEDPANGPWLRAPAIWRLQLNGLSVGPAEKVVVLKDPLDLDNLWESSGIVDASEWFGRGAWIFDTQAHGIDAQTSRGDYGQIIYMKLDD